MAKLNLGRVGIVPQGDFDNTKTYSKMDMVYYSTTGSSYVSLVDNNTALPTDSTKWQSAADVSNEVAAANAAATRANTAAEAAEAVSDEVAELKSHSSLLKDRLDDISDPVTSELNGVKTSGKNINWTKHPADANTNYYILTYTSGLISGSAVLIDGIVSNGGYLYAFYDESDNVLSTSEPGTAVAGLQNVEAVIPEGATTLVVSGHESSSYPPAKCLIITGYVSSLSDDVADLNAKIGDLSALETTEKSNVVDAINEINDKVDDVVSLDASRNLCDQSQNVTGGLQSDGSISTSGSWASYSTSDYIPVSPNTNYVFSVYLESTMVATTDRRICAQYDANKNLISGTYQNVSNTSTYNSILTVATAKYVRVSSIATYRLYQLEAGTEPTAYQPYYRHNVINMLLGDVPLAQVTPMAGNVLYGKKWAVCGDSFTQGATETLITDAGKYYGYRYNYPYLIGNRNDMEIIRHFNGGETLAYPSDGTFATSLTNPNYQYYYQNIPADADYITIYLGINDSHHAPGSSGGDGEDNTGEIPIGTIDDATTATYYGAWNVILTWLMTNRPFAHIGMIVSNGCDTDDYRTAQIAIARKYGIPFIDLNGDDRTPVMIRSRNNNIAYAVRTLVTQKQAVDYDGTITGTINLHPNDNAHLYESYFIEDFLRSI